MIPSWNDYYLDRNVLKNEANCMVEAFVEILLEEIPQSDIEGIYFKGSAQKDWESPLDYVPELSDVDIHLLFSDDSLIEKNLGSTVKAMEIQSKVEARYFSKVPKPLHVPRPQLVILNQLLRDENYIPSPQNIVSVLYGKEYEKPDYSNPEKIRLIDCNRLISEEEYLARFPRHVIDKPSRYLWDSLKGLVWRVSPIGPRVLHISGIPTEKAWGINRTKMVPILKEIGEYQLAQCYSEFYLFAWKYFLSKYSDSDAGRAALMAGINVMSRGMEIGTSWLSKHSTNQ